MLKIIELEGQINEGGKGTVFRLYEEIFHATVSAEMQERMAVMQDILVLLAVTDDGRYVGFKMGYREDPDTFYSWLGGVLPDYRGKGIAAQLMTQQHCWCLDKGYKYIRTKTMNQWRSMLLLNIRMGFDIIGVQVGRNGVAKIILEKTL